MIVIDINALCQKLRPILKVNKNIREDGMNTKRFEPIMLMALLLPLLCSYLGYLLYSPGSGNVQPPTAVEQKNIAVDGDTLLIQTPGTETQPTESKNLGFKELILYLALLCGTTTLLWQYMKTTLGWIAVILLPLGFSYLYLDIPNISLMLFYLLNLGLAVALALLVRYLFFKKELMRFRLIICSLLGAGLLTLYYRCLYFLMKVDFPGSEWTNKYLTSLILFVFVSFGMSLADMVILRLEYKKAQQRKEQEEEDDTNA
jgi:hypothetical protein